MTNYQKQLNQKFELIKNFDFSTFNSLDTPFFMNNSKKRKFNELNNKDGSNYINKFKNIPTLIKVLYNVVNNKTESYFKDWTFMTLNIIKEKHILKYNNGQKDILDFAFSYSGMGWIFIAAIDLKSGKIFIRLDGGSNDYDRQFNFNNIIKYKTDSTNQKYMNIEEFEDFIGLNNIEEKEDMEVKFNIQCIEY